jgi:Ca-activated chloride channel family protein
MSALLVALARPSLSLPVARDETTVMLAIDTSGSMSASDVAPSRLAAAQQAASAFVDELPSRLRVGVVAFSSDVRVVVAPTTDRHVIHAGLDSLVADGGTAIGDAIEASLAAVGLTSSTEKATAMVQAPAAHPSGAPADPSGRPLGDQAWPKPAAPTSPTVATVLLSDGESTVGTDPLVAAGDAARYGVPVYTIALGTADGTVELPDENGQLVSVAVPPDTGTLSKVAERTGATFFDAPSSADLSGIYRSLGSKIGYRIEPQEATRLFAAIGLAFVLLGAGCAALWFNRFP